MMPRTVILGPDVSVHTPEWLFLSTGVRAIDHAVGTFARSTASRLPKAPPSTHFALLGKGLPAVKADPANLEVRLDCQIGAWMSMVGSQTGVSEALGRPGESAAEVAAELISGLGLPTRLRDVGVKSEQRDLIAEGSIHDRWVHTNSRKIDGPAVIRTLLDAGW
jgi:maleylacetate reductase